MEQPFEDKIKNIKDWLGTGSINIFGPPYSGKDTQSKILAKSLNGVAIGSGDILRHKAHTPTNVLKEINKGKLAPTKEYLELVPPFLSLPEYSAVPLVLSSVGRWHGEEDTVLQASKESNHPIKAVIYLKSREDKIWERFEKAMETKDRGKRDDDAKDVLKVRLDEFKSKTLPVIEFYRQKKLLIEVDGAQSLEKVTLDIISGLFDFMQI